MTPVSARPSKLQAARTSLWPVFGPKFASPGRPSKCSAPATTFTLSKNAAVPPRQPPNKQLCRAWARLGAVSVTTIAALLEWQRDWAKKNHYNNLMGLLKGQAGAYGVGVEYAYTMVHHAPQSALKPQIVPKKAA